MIPLCLIQKKTLWFPIFCLKRGLIISFSRSHKLVVTISLAGTRTLRYREKASHITWLDTPGHCRAPEIKAPRWISSWIRSAIWSGGVQAPRVALARLLSRAAQEQEEMDERRGKSAAFGTTLRTGQTHHEEEVLQFCDYCRRFQPDPQLGQETRHRGAQRVPGKLRDKPTSRWHWLSYRLSKRPNFWRQVVGCVQDGADWSPYQALLSVPEDKRRRECDHIVPPWQTTANSEHRTGGQTQTGRVR